MLKKAAAGLLVCVSMAMWGGCGTTKSHYLYAAIPASNEIVIYREDPNSGVLTQLAGSPVTAGLAVESLVIHPSKKFLYAANSGDNNISLFTISSTGSLTEVTPRTKAGTAPTVLAMDAAGTFLYAGNAGSFDVSVFSIDPGTGALTPVLQATGPTAGLGISPLNMHLAPSGNVLYVTGEGTQGVVEAFAVNAGVFSSTPIPSSPTGNNPFGLTVNAAGTFLYTANTSDGSISEFQINADGSLTTLQSSPIGQTPASSPVALLIDNSGKYMYSVNSQSAGTLFAYSVGTDGGLTLIANSQFSAGAQPRAVASDPSGKYLFVGGQSSIQSLSLDASTGILTSVASYPVTGATSIVITP